MVVDLKISLVVIYVRRIISTEGIALGSPPPLILYGNGQKLAYHMHLSYL